MPVKGLITCNYIMYMYTHIITIEKKKENIFFSMKIGLKLQEQKNNHL